MIRRVDVAVTTHVDQEGNITPLSVFWEDGTEYMIDRITDKIRAASLKAGGIGIRFTCRIQGKQTYLFFEDPKWFVEGKR